MKAKGGKKEKGVISHWPFQSPPPLKNNEIRQAVWNFHGAKKRFNRLKSSLPIIGQVT
jgi:hypothetical protein